MTSREASLVNTPPTYYEGFERPPNHVITLDEK